MFILRDFYTCSLNINWKFLRCYCWTVFSFHATHVSFISNRYHPTVVNCINKKTKQNRIPKPLLSQYIKLHFYSVSPGTVTWSIPSVSSAHNVFFFWGEFWPLNPPPLCVRHYPAWPMLKSRRFAYHYTEKGSFGCGRFDAMTFLATWRWYGLGSWSNT